MWVKPFKLGKKVSTLLVSPSGYQHRVLRRAFSKVGVNVDKVVRIRIGPIDTKGLKKGGARRLTEAEVRSLVNPAPEHVGVSSLSTNSRSRSTTARKEIQDRRSRAHERRKNQRAFNAKRRAGGKKPPSDTGSGRRIIGP